MDHGYKIYSFRHSSLAQTHTHMTCIRHWNANKRRIWNLNEGQKLVDSLKRSYICITHKTNWRTGIPNHSQRSTQTPRCCAIILQRFFKKREKKWEDFFLFISADEEKNVSAKNKNLFSRVKRNGMKMLGKDVFISRFHAYEIISCFTLISSSPQVMNDTHKLSDSGFS